MYYTIIICQVYMLTHLILDYLLKQQKSHIDLQQKFKNQAGLGMSLIWQSACLASIKAWVQSSAPSKSGGSGRKIRNSRLPWAVDQVWGTLGQHVSVSINKNCTTHSMFLCKPGEWKTFMHFKQNILSNANDYTKDLHCILKETKGG